MRTRANSEEPTVNLVLARPGETALVVAVTVEIGFGVRGEALRHVSVNGDYDAGQGGDLQASAEQGARGAYHLLYREKYLDRTAIVSFTPTSPLHNLTGRSADLGFALAMLAAQARHAGITVPPLVATGELSDAGTILPVNALEEKLTAALAVLPEGGVFVYPQGCAPVRDPLAAQAQAQGIRLLAGERLDAVARELGLPLSRSWTGSPFRGLEAFDFEHAAIFFGREEEIEAVLALLGRRLSAGAPAVLIEGVSGAGKSSLARAGVLPALARRGLSDIPAKAWRVATIMPADLLTGEDGKLTATLARQWLPGEVASKALATPTALARKLLDAGLRPLILLDQLEQCFEANADPVRVTAAAELLAGLNALGVVLLATITRDGAAALSDHPLLAACFGVEGIYRLEPRLAASHLQAIIEKPAAAAGLSYEPGLAAELLTAAAHGGQDVLPLLELLLSELFERRDPARQALRNADYKEMGGLDGVVGASMASVYAHLAETERPAIDRLLWKLTTRREMVLADFPEADPIHAAINALREKRLLAIDQHDGVQIARPAHEALLRHWPYAAAWRAVHDSDVLRWRELCVEARQWHQGQRSLIPSGPQLEAAIDLVARRAADWTASDQPTLAYVRASRHRMRARRGLLGSGAALVGVGTLGAGIMKLWEWNDLRHQRVIRFDSVHVPPPDYMIAAADTLGQQGLRVVDIDPPDAHIQIVGNSAVYDGRAVDSASGEHFLREQAGHDVGEISYTLALDRPARAVELVRVGLWPATGSGVSHPSWSAQALDAQGQMIDRVDEPMIRAFQRVPERRFRLTARNDIPISQLRITSDYRLHGKPFAGSQSVILSEIKLIY